MAGFNKSKPGSNAKLFSMEKIQLCGQHAVRASSEYMDKGIPLRLRNYFLWTGTVMITVSLQTEGENREATLAAYQKVYEEALATLTIDDVPATPSAATQGTTTTQQPR